MSLVADPARPNDYYGFLTDGSGTAIHVVKSEDYGATWSVVNTTAMSGDPWGATIDPNPNRDPCEPPTMYTPAGYGTGGLFKSVDGGVTWTQTFVFSAGNNPFAAYAQYPSDTYSAAILPDDPPNHVLVTFHGGCWVPYDGGSWGSCANDAGLGESLDGGATWIVHPPPLGIGASQYLMVVDSSTWLTISQDGASNGIWKTSTAGRVGGVVSTSAWKKVDSATHIHGSFQGLVTTSAIYAPHSGGIKRSIDRGETWTPVYTKGGMSWVAPTALYLYADYLMGPTLLRSAIGDGATWSSYTTTPSGMAGGLGPGTQTVVYSSDGAHHYIVDYNNGGGVWRYVE